MQQKADAAPDGGGLDSNSDATADDEQFDLFGAPAVSEPAAPLEPKLDALAKRLPDAIHLGTSTWSFPGWRGIVYGDEYSNTKLSRDGLSAYGAHPLLRSVSIDRSFYSPLSLAEYARYASQVPEHFASS